MAKSKTAVKKSPKVEWKGYLNVNLDDAEAAAFEAWETERVFGISDVAILVDNGYKFTLAWDAFHSGFTASLYSSLPILAWPGYTLTAWAGSAEDAMRLLFFKHYIICEEDWERFTGKVEKSGRLYG